MTLQIFGTRKCGATRKAERFFKERGQAYQFVDLAEKGLSAGELAGIRKASGGTDLVDREGKAFRDAGLAFMEYNEDEEILRRPLILRTPLVRSGKLATVGEDPDGWKKILTEL